MFKVMQQKYMTQKQNNDKKYNRNNFCQESNKLSLRTPT